MLGEVSFRVTGILLGLCGCGGFVIFRGFGEKLIVWLVVLFSFLMFLVPGSQISYYS